MLQLIETGDINRSAKLTFTNMKPYYDLNNVDWDLNDVSNAITELTNYDIYVDDKLVGALRLSFNDNRCQLRDIQVKADLQSKGLGAKTIAKTIELAKDQDAQFIDLKVFKNSPAHRLYSRLGFITEQSDERFYHMSLAI